MTPQPLIVETDDRGVCLLTLNRPEKHNAFDDELIALLIAQLQQINASDDVRVVVLTGQGKSFSSGADLAWMQSMVNYDLKTNRHDAQRLATLMRLLFTCSKPTIARVNGSAFGGALGLIACCDIAVSVIGAKFAFTEVKLGLVPAVISPYINAAMGRRQAQRLFLTAEVFTAELAWQLGLVTHYADESGLDDTIARQVELLLQGGPQAQLRCKELMIHQQGIAQATESYAVDCIAKIRVSDEGQEGLSAFLEKRDPNWLK